LVKGDLVSGRSRVVGSESSVIGWLAVALASVGEATVERVKRRMQQKVWFCRIHNQIWRNKNEKLN